MRAYVRLTRCVAWTPLVLLMSVNPTRAELRVPPQVTTEAGQAFSWEPIGGASVHTIQNSRYLQPVSSEVAEAPVPVEPSRLKVPNPPSFGGTKAVSSEMPASSEGAVIPPASGFMPAPGTPTPARLPTMPVGERPPFQDAYQLTEDGYLPNAPHLPPQVPAYPGRPNPGHHGDPNYPGLSFSMPFRSDRPKFTPVTETVGLGNWQVSGGYTYFRNESPSLTEPVRFRHQAGELLVRYGVMEELELRFSFDGYLYEKYVGDVTEDGISRANVGFKKTLCEQKGWVPAVAMLGDIGFTVGDDTFDGDAVTGGLMFTYRWNISASTEAGGSIGARHEQVYDDEFREFDFSLYTQSRLWQELYGFAEYIGKGFDDRGDSYPEHIVQCGLIYYVTPHCQIDVRVGSGVFRDDDLFTGVGLVLLK